MFRELLPSLCTVSFGLSILAWSSAPGLVRIVTALLYLSGCGSWTFLSVMSESGAPASSPDEPMLDWLVASVRGGIAPKGVLLWFFPVFGDLLFCMINVCVEEV